MSMKQLLATWLLVFLRSQPELSQGGGAATLTDAQAKDLADGKWYFNIHTAANKGGEIRGQVIK